MKKKIYYALALAFAGLTFASCDSFLDTLPDNRTTIDSEDKVKSIITSAYPDVTYALVTETMSDNADNYGASNPYTDRFYDQVYAWQDITEVDNDAPEQVWDKCYNAIANANLALEGIEKLGGATTSSLKELKAEALLARAYNHFILVNIFCKNYNSKTSATDLGMSYVEKPMTELDPKMPRGTVAEDYEKIDRDLQEALPNVGDGHLSVPKYHFNARAAYAFACRFYLYYEKWDEAIKYANLCLGASPKSLLRDWKDVGAMTQTFEAVSQHYVQSDLNCNLLLTTAVTSLGITIGPYYVNSKYSHGNYLATNEDANANNIWGSASLYEPVRKYTATNLDKSIIWKVPFLFEYTDQVAGIGYRRTVIPAFTTDECLLNRAEAYIMKKQYDNAAKDLTMWMQNFVNTTKTLTPDNITEFYNSVGYSYSDEKGIESTIKKHLHPAFAIDAENSIQECMLQCVLGFRRIETLHQGMRWFDIKRYGIEIVRRTMNASGVPETKTDVLLKDDDRRAIQIPQKCIDAGVEPNPRATK